MKIFLAFACMIFFKVGKSTAIPIFEHDLIDEYYYPPEILETYLVPINALPVVPVKLPPKNETKPTDIGESKQFGVYRPIYFRPWKWPSRHNPVLNPLYGLRNPYYQGSGASSHKPGVSYGNYQSIYGATSIYDIGGFYG